MQQDDDFDPKNAALNMLGGSGIPLVSDLAGAASFGQSMASAPDKYPPVNPQDIPAPASDQLNMPPGSGGSAPGLGDLTKSLTQTPSTNYDFYKNMSADARAKLYQSMVQKQISPGSLVAQGAAGIGDAISRSFGGQHTDYQKGVMEQGQKATEGALQSFDTGRQQKMQDMQANMEMQQNDPKSPLSQSMQKMFRANGINVPSGMPANLMMKIAPALGEMAIKQAELASMNQYRKGELGQKSAELQNKEDTYKSEHPILNFLNPIGNASPNSPVSNPALAHGVPDLGQTFNGGKVLKVTRIK